MPLKTILKMPAKHAVIRILCFIAIIISANIMYGYLHETGHAIAVEALGGHVYGMYVNLEGTDAYTLHSTIGGIDQGVLVEAAGMAVTTLLGFLSLYFGYGPLTWFLALRTSLYAINFDPGTDISNIQTLIGPGALLMTGLIIALNVACVCLSIKIALSRKAGDSAPSASSSHARQTSNN